MVDVRQDTPEEIMDEVSLDAALPGESLTKTPQKFPHDRPPQFTDPGEFLDYLFERMTQPGMVKKAVALMSAGIPVDKLGAITLNQAFSKGLAHPAAIALAAPAFTLMLTRMADAAGVNWKLTDDPDVEGTVSEVELLAAKLEMEDKQVGKAEREAELSKTDLTSLSEGLMARPEGA